MAVPAAPDSPGPGAGGRFAFPLFWRSFLLILALLVAGILAWLPAARVFEREPRAHQIAQRLVSVVHTTRAALIYSDPARRSELVGELFDNESIRIVPLEPGDVVVPLNDTALLALVEQEVRRHLGPQTRLAQSVNGVRGFWVSFSIDDDAYWVYLERDVLRRETSTGWIVFALLAASLSLLGAVLIARLVNRPLAALSQAAVALGAGRTPPMLPESGPPEICTVNRSFNRMASDLAKLDHDRSVLLAGISHDLRTPLTRLRLELELSRLPESTLRALTGDLDQIDAIVGQFLEFAMPGPSRPAIPVDLSALVLESVDRFRSAPSSGPDDAGETPRIHVLVPDGILVDGHPTELSRAILNLLGNAQRYGRDAAGGLDLTVELLRSTACVTLAISDRGPGISPGDRERVLRPFERGDSARSGTGGAGLGLSIVERIARLHGASLRLLDNPPHGLRIEMQFPSPDLVGGAGATPAHTGR